jgi:hypothetical protein
VMIMAKRKLWMGCPIRGTINVIKLAQRFVVH